MAQQAQETFTASPEGIPILVQKGQVFPDRHPLVKLDDGRGLLFKPLDLDQAADGPAKETAVLPKRPGKAAG